MDALPFRKPAKTARLAKPSAENRRELISSLLTTAAAMEANPEWVGYALVGLRSDGKKMSWWAASKDALAQLERVVRSEARNIAKEVREPWN